MKVIIAGSRTITLMSVLEQAVVRAGNYWMSSDQDNWQNYMYSEIISGGAQGADALGERYAIKKQLPLKTFPANWEKFGKKAGALRNIEMAEYADALIALWDGKSKGTFHIISEMVKRNKLVYIQCP